MQTLYARREPTNDTVLLKYKPGSKRKDVVFYVDKGCTQFYARIPWYHTNCPRTRTRVTFNCNSFAVEWIKGD